MTECAKEQQILKAAERLFTTRRFHEVTMDDVRNAAGVGKGTIYRYFKDKDDLFFRLVTSGFTELCASLRATESDGALFEDQLTRSVTALHEFFKRRRELFRIMQMEETRSSFNNISVRSRWKEHRKELISALSGIMRRGAEAGMARADLPPEALASALLGMLRGFVGHSETTHSDYAITDVVNLFIHGAGFKPALHEKRGSSST